MTSMPPVPGAEGFASHPPDAGSPPFFSSLAAAFPTSPAASSSLPAVVPTPDPAPRPAPVSFVARPAKIKVIGLGGAGSNSVEGLLELGLDEVDYLVVNTDAQALAGSTCTNKLQLGLALTQGLGAGADPELGRQAAEASREDIVNFLRGSDMVFLTAGMGGGTGTGAAPVVARIARELGVLCVSFVTKPFKFEGKKRQERAKDGIDALAQESDTLMVVANDKLLTAVPPGTPLRDAFAVANTVLAQAVQAIHDVVHQNGLVNVDFADVRAVLANSGDAIIGIGRAKGEQRASTAVKRACSSPVLDTLVTDGAGGILVSIVGGPDLSLHEVSEAVTLVTKNASPDANIIFGATVDDQLGEDVRVTVLATRFLRADETTIDESGEDTAAVATSPFEKLFGLDLSNEPEPVGVGAGAAPLHASTNGGSKPANGAGADTSTLEADNEEGFDLPAYLRRRRRRFF